MGANDKRGDGEKFEFARESLVSIRSAQLQRLGVVPVPNQSRALFMSDTATQVRYVVKRDIHPSDLHAEAIGWLTSRELGVKTPAGAVVSGTPSGWASRALDHVLSWDPRDAQLCSAEDVAGIFVLDAVIGNPDRHNDNVLVAEGLPGEPYEVWSIDLGNAWVGDAEGFVERGMTVPVDCQFLRGVSRSHVQALAAPFVAAAARLASEPGKLEALLFQVNVQTRGLPAEAQKMLAEALRARLTAAGSLLDAYLDRTLGNA
jgi:hypothetical protein